jgi:hypothetical protein
MAKPNFSILLSKKGLAVGLAVVVLVAYVFGFGETVCNALGDFAPTICVE